MARSLVHSEQVRTGQKNRRSASGVENTSRSIGCDKFEGQCPLPPPSTSASIFPPQNPLRRPHRQGAVEGLRPPHRQMGMLRREPG